MRRTRSLNVSLVIATMATVLPSARGIADPPADPAVQELVIAHNRERVERRQGAVALSPKLCEAALVHAQDMAKNKALDHKGSDGSTVADRVKRVRYVYVRVGENIARGQTTVAQVMESWMKSPGHRANILSDFSEMGGAKVVDDEGTSYWCVTFGIPMPQLKPDEAAGSVVTTINREREAGKKAPLKVDLPLARAAMELSAAMAAKDSFEIDGDPFKVLGESATRGRDIRVQMSANVPTPEAAAKDLVGTEPKRLDGFREIGVGYALSRSGTPYWCAIFARPTGVNRPGAAR